MSHSERVIEMVAIAIVSAQQDHDDLESNSLDYSDILDRTEGNRDFLWDLAREMGIESEVAPIIDREMSKHRAQNPDYADEED